MNLSENIFGIDGLNDIGTVFFLIAIISLSMKKFMNKNNWTVSANHCFKIVSHCGISLSAELTLPLWEKNYGKQKNLWYKKIMGNKDSWYSPNIFSSIYCF